MIPQRSLPDVEGSRGAKLRGIAAAWLLAIGLVFGGGTRNYVFSDLIVQLFAIGMLAFALWKMHWQTISSERRQILCLLLSVVGLVLLQLLPIPTSLWALSPGRDQLLQSHNDLGIALPAFRPWTTDSNATWASLRAIIPAAALLVVGIQLHEVWRRRLLTIVLFVALVSVPLGLAQIVQGPASELRFYTPTNNQQAVGLFANRNHYAALLYVGLALALGFFLAYDQHFRSRMTTKGAFQAIGWTLAGAFLMAGLMLSRSRAGVGLALLVMALMAIAAFARRRRHALVFRWLLALLLLGASFAAYFGYSAFSSRLESDWLDQSRWLVTTTTMSLAKDYGWLGTGLGSFPSAYAAFEPIEVLGDKIINHAHNDWAELWVELGWVFVPLLLYFGYWIWQRCVEFQTQGGLRAMPPLVVASMVALLALLIHSFVDYPLRTTTLSMVIVTLILQLLPNLEVDPAESYKAPNELLAHNSSPSERTGRRPMLRVLEGGQARREKR